MFLIQLIVPLHDNDKAPFPKNEFESHELTQNFGGVTAFLGSPAIGLWKDDDDEVSRDDVVMFEVMVDQLDRDWWAQFRRGLEERFRQEEVNAIAMGPYLRCSGYNLSCFPLETDVTFRKPHPGSRVPRADCRVPNDRKALAPMDIVGVLTKVVQD